MKLREIKLMTIAKYSIDVPWCSLKNTIERYEEEFKFEMSPDFQRDYVWREEDASKYIEWILKGGRSGRDIYLNCQGWMRKFEGPMVVVDGQQRLTSVLKFLNNEVKAFGYYLDEFEDKEYTRNNFEYGFKFHIADLDNKKDVVQWYLDLNECGVAHTDADLQKARQILENTN
jgi:uncharacterized protein with ParB-like and HNH nuclease domain